MSEWFLMVPEDSGPELVNLHDDDTQVRILSEQRMRRARGAAEAAVFRIDMASYRIVPVRLREVTRVEIEDVGDASVYVHVDGETSILPGPGVLPQRRPRRETILNGDDSPPSYDDLTAGSVGPFVRRSD